MTDDLHLARVEARYRQAVQEELSLEQGFAPGVTLSVSEPEPPEDVGLEELRLLDRAGREGGLPPKQALQLEALRFQRRKRQLLKLWSEPRRSTAPEERRPWEEALNTPLHILQGETCSGKSAMLRMAAVRQARRKQGLDGRRPCLPLYVPLDAYDGPSAGMLLHNLVASYWKRRWPFLGLEQVFLGALETGRALVLVDGLDAFPFTSDRQLFPGLFHEWVNRWGGIGNRFVLTHRPLTPCEFPELAGYSRELVLGVAPEGVEELSCRTYEAWGQSAREESLALDEALRRAPRVALLASSARVLPRLMTLRRTLGRFPPRVTEFYESYVRQCLEGREAALSPLMELALLLRRSHPSGVARREDVAAILSGWSPEGWKKLLGDGCLVVDHGQDTVSFLVPELGDFLAGRALAHRSAEERWRILQPHLHDARWSETVRMCAGLLADRGEPELSVLVRSILSANSEFEPVLHRDVLLAADVALAVGGRVMEFLDGPQERLRQEAAKSLRELVDTEEAFRQRMLEWLGDALPHRRRMAIHVLSQRAEKDEPVRHAVRARLEDPDRHVRSEVLSALHARMGSDQALEQECLAELKEESPHARASALSLMRHAVGQRALLRQAALERLDDPDGRVREAALEVLAPLGVEDEEVHRRIRERMEDPVADVRFRAVAALSHRLEREPALAEELLPWVGAFSGGISHWHVRRELFPRLAALAAREPGLIDRIALGLRSREWHQREGTLLVLLALPGELPSAWMLELRRLLEDLSEGPHVVLGERISSSEVAKALLGAPDPELRDSALAYVLEGLEHTRRPWFDDWHRSHESALLNLLRTGWKPLFRDERVLAHVLRLLQEHQVGEDGPGRRHSPIDREKLYELLLSLASV